MTCMQNPPKAYAALQSVVIPDLQIVRDIGTALKLRDDMALWAAARRAESQETFYEQLRAQVGYTTFSGVLKRVHKDQRECHVALLGVPVLLASSDAALVGNSPATKTALNCVRGWLMEWFEYQGEITLYSALFGYHDICMWTPSVMRSRLDGLVDPKSASAQVPQAVDFGLPSDAPVLAFIIGAVHRPLAWPQLPPLDPEADLKLQARISGALQLCSPGGSGNRITVLTPAFASEAIAEGLDRWFGAIASAYELKGWDMHQCDQDLVIAHLEVGEDAANTSAVPLRAHQLGLDGIERRLSQLSALCAWRSAEDKKARS